MNSKLETNVNVPVYFRSLKRGINSFNLVNSRVLMIVGISVVQTFIIIENIRYQFFFFFFFFFLSREKKEKEREKKPQNKQNNNIDNKHNRTKKKKKKNQTTNIKQKQKQNRQTNLNRTTDFIITSRYIVQFTFNR